MESPTYILAPKTKIITHEKLDSTGGMFVAKQHLDARKPSTTGLIIGPIGGHGGDVYSVHHEDGSIACYCYTEFELVVEKTSRMSMLRK